MKLLVYLITMAILAYYLIGNAQKSDRLVEEYYAKFIEYNSDYISPYAEQKSKFNTFTDLGKKIEK